MSVESFIITLCKNQYYFRVGSSSFLIPEKCSVFYGLLFWLSLIGGVPYCAAAGARIHFGPRLYNNIHECHHGLSFMVSLSLVSLNS